MIKIRNGVFETNSSSVHSIAWTDKILDDDTETEFSNVIDIYLYSKNIYYDEKDTFVTFEEKVSALYAYVTTNFFRKKIEFEDSIGIFDYVDSLYVENKYSPKFGFFRDFYNEEKSTLISIVEELSNKKYKITNENHFKYFTRDDFGKGYMPSNDYEDLKEILLNKNIVIKFQRVFDDKMTNVISKNSLVELYNKRKEEELTWFDWFKK